MMKKGKRITFWYTYPKSIWTSMAADIFEISSDGKITHLEHHEDVDVDRDGRLIIAP
jgi:hypothetical protein